MKTVETHDRRQMRAASPGAGRGNGVPLVIDGEAVVISRRRCGTPADAGIAAAFAGSFNAERDPATSNAGPAEFLFGRRPRQRRPAPRDLVFQGALAAPFARDDARGNPLVLRPRTFAGRFPDRLVLKRNSVGLTLVGGLVLLPILLLGTRAIASLAAAPNSRDYGIVLSELTSSVQPRGAGAVLAVEGLIQNLSDADAPVPPLRIALAGATGVVQSRAFMAGVRDLGAGRSLRFRSAVAIAAGTRGEVEIGFLDSALPKTVSR